MLSEVEGIKAGDAFAVVSVGTKYDCGGGVGGVAGSGRGGDRVGSGADWAGVPVAAIGEIKLGKEMVNDIS